MTRPELNTVLIEAVKKSVGIDYKFPALKTFVQISDIMDLVSNSFNKNIYTAPNYFYSNRAQATGEDLVVEYPILFLIDMEPTINYPFRIVKKNGTYIKNANWNHNIQIGVAFKDQNEEPKDELYPEMLLRYCQFQLDWVFTYMAEYNDKNDQQHNDRLQKANENLIININHDFNGMTVAWANIKFDECVNYDFLRSIRTSHCCGQGVDHTATGVVVDSDGDKPSNNQGQNISKFE